VVVREHGGTPVKVLAVVDRAPDVEGRFDVPFATAISLSVETHDPADCPLCREGVLPAIKPGSRGSA